MAIQFSNSVEDIENTAKRLLYKAALAYWESLHMQEFR